MEQEDQASIIIDDGGEILDTGSESDASSSSSVPKPDCFYEFTRNGMMKIGEESKDYRPIKNQFLTGMKQLANDTSVVAIHKNICSTLYMQARFNAFKSCVHAVRERRRDRNFKYGWFPSTIEDENGLRHTLFCYVEMGKMELIRAGSKQIYPSSVEFDSGVDNLEDPSRLVVWSAYMNSFTLPICILSFKAPSFSIVSLREQINEVRPGGEMLSCAALFPNLVKVFGPAKWDMICKSVDDYRKCKINRVQMIQSLKRIIGSDPMLMSVLKAIRGKLAVRAPNRSGGSRGNN